MEPPVALRSACTGAESVVFHPPLKRYRTPFGLAKGTFVTFCPCKGSGDCARRGVPRFLRPDSRSQLLREDLIRDARVRLRPHQGAVGFVVLGLLALAGQPILFCVMGDVVAHVNLRLWIHGPWPPPAGHARFQGAGVAQKSHADVTGEDPDGLETATAAARTGRRDRASCQVPSSLAPSCPRPSYRGRPWPASGDRPASASRAARP